MCKENVTKFKEKERFERLLLLIKQTLERGERKILKLCSDYDTRQ